MGRSASIGVGVARAVKVAIVVLAVPVVLFVALGDLGRGGPESYTREGVASKAQRLALPATSGGTPEITESGILIQRTWMFLPEREFRFIRVDGQSEELWRLSRTGFGVGLWLQRILVVAVFVAAYLWLRWLSRGEAPEE